MEPIELLEPFNLVCYVRICQPSFQFLLYIDSLLQSGQLSIKVGKENQGLLNKRKIYL